MVDNTAPASRIAPEKKNGRTLSGSTSEPCSAVPREQFFNAGAHMPNLRGRNTVEVTTRDTCHVTEVAFQLVCSPNGGAA